MQIPLIARNPIDGTFIFPRPDALELGYECKFCYAIRSNPEEFCGCQDAEYSHLPTPRTRPTAVRAMLFSRIVD